MNTTKARAPRILFTTLAGMLLTCVSATTAAESPEGAFEMLVISDEAFGKAVIQGDHETAIYNMTAVSERRFSRFSVSNNLCVAYVRADDPEQAAAHCDKAVSISRWLPDRERAVALSNRGVLLAITGQPTAALRDLRTAARLRSRLAVPGANLTLLSQRMDKVARATTR